MMAPKFRVAIRAAILAPVMVTASTLTVGAAFAANAPGDNGDVKIHDSTTDPLDERNEPKVCKFYVVGTGFDANHDLHYDIVAGPAFKGKPVLEGDIDVDGKGFGRSPDLTLPDGQYKLLTTFVGENGRAKQKVFKVDCPDANAVTPAEDPPAEDPPAEDPPAEDPPAEDPPAEDPPAEDPPAEDPPAEDPPAEDPPVEEAVDNPETQAVTPADPEASAPADSDETEVAAVNQPQAQSESAEENADVDTAARPAGAVKAGGGGMAGGSGPSDLPIALLGGSLVIGAGVLGGRAWLRR